MLADWPPAIQYLQLKECKSGGGGGFFWKAYTCSSLGSAAFFVFALCPVYLSHKGVDCARMTAANSTSTEHISKNKQKKEPLIR